MACRGSPAGRGGARSGQGQRTRLLIPPGPVRSLSAGREGTRRCGRRGGVPPPVAGGGECPASRRRRRRRRLSPAVTARRGCVCLQLLQSLLLLPTPRWGPGARPGRGDRGRRGGAQGSPAHRLRRPLRGAGPEAGGGQWGRRAGAEAAGPGAALPPRARARVARAHRRPHGELQAERRVRGRGARRSRVAARRRGAVSGRWGRVPAQSTSRAACAPRAAGPRAAA